METHYSSYNPSFCPKITLSLSEFNFLFIWIWSENTATGDPPLCRETVVQGFVHQHFLKLHNFFYFTHAASSNLFLSIVDNKSFWILLCCIHPHLSFLSTCFYIKKREQEKKKSFQRFLHHRLMHRKKERPIFFSPLKKREGGKRRMLTKTLCKIKKGEKPIIWCGH